MTDESLLHKIKERVDSDIAYLTNAKIQEDVRYLLSLLEEKSKKIEHLQKKSDVLGNQVLELTQEIENVKRDFGDMR